MNKESGYIPPAGASKQGRLDHVQKAGQFGDLSVEGGKAPEARQKELREVSVDSKESLQSHSVEVVKFSGGLWPKVLGVSIPPVGVSSQEGGESIKESAKPSGGLWSKVVRVYDQTRALVTEKTGLITSHSVDLDGIILNASKDPARAAKVFAKWGREAKIAKQIGLVDDGLEERFALSVLEKAGLLELDPETPGRIKYLTPEDLLRLQLLTDSIDKLEQNPEFIKHLGDNPDAQRGFMSMKQGVGSEGFQFQIARLFINSLAKGEQEWSREEGIPQKIALGAVLFYKGLPKENYDVEIKLESGSDSVTVKADVFGVYKRLVLPFAEDKDGLVKVFDALEDIVYTELGYASRNMMMSDAILLYRLLKKSGDYPWEELGLLADTIQRYEGEHSFPGSEVSSYIQKHTQDYFERAKINFDLDPLRDTTSSGELHSVLFLRNLSIDQLELVLSPKVFSSLKGRVLSDFKEHESFLDRESIQKHFGDEAANILIFGTTFFETKLYDGESVGGFTYTARSEVQLKAFCKEVMSPDDYEQVVENKLHPPSPVDLMRELKPEDIVELFNRNGVWNNYTDEQIEKMLPEGVAMIDILDARDGV